MSAGKRSTTMNEIAEREYFSLQRGAEYLEREGKDLQERASENKLAQWKVTQRLGDILSYLGYTPKP